MYKNQKCLKDHPMGIVLDYGNESISLDYFQAFNHQWAASGYTIVIAIGFAKAQH
jgi:hypothetical protein